MRLIETSESLVDLLGHRARRQPEDDAYTFLESGEHEGPKLTWGALDRRCRAIGDAIAARTPPGSRVLLMYPPGLDFVSGFFGCLYAGAIAVPTYPPSGSRADRAIARLRGMIADSGTSLIAGPSSLLDRLPQIATVVPELQGIASLATDEVADEQADDWRHPAVRRDTIAFLQYTSGSTATPRGVMVTHGNLLHNLDTSAQLAQHDEESLSVSWLPVNHDMGLIDGVLQPAYSGFPAYLMAPAAFLQRPARWLHAISRLRATHSGGPNFAYDLCVRRVTAADRLGLDLSAWRIAFNGSEPVRRGTLESFQRTFGECGFRWTSFRPAYGLAESTLLVSSSPGPEEPHCIDVDRAALARGRVIIRNPSQAVPALRPDPGFRTPNPGPRTPDPGISLVASGSPAPGTQIVIVDPLRRTRCTGDRIGEIWVAGPSVAQGYWHLPAKTEETFGARLATGEGPFLRTGDLGFLHGSHLVVTGRIKDLLIVRGLKHYPQDLELTAERAADVVRPGCCAAFAVESNGEERAALVAEIDVSRATGTETHQLMQTIAEIRRRVTEAHQIAVSAVTLVVPGSLAKTTSGKLQRHICRDAFLSGDLETLAEWQDLDTDRAPSVAVRDRVAS